MSAQRYDLRQIDRELFELAKWWDGAMLACKIVGILLGLLVILTGLLSKIIPVAAILLTLVAEFCSWNSGRFKGMAETLLTKLDWNDAFGRKFSRKEISDLLMDLPARFRRSFSEEIQEQYFTARTLPGARRAVENLLESSWWSKHLSKKIGFRYQVATWVIVVASLAILIVTIQTVKDFDQLASVGRAITSFVMCIFSFGLLKLSYAYSSFSAKAAQIESRAEELLNAEPTQEEAITLMYDYQIVRLKAPLIPTWLYKHFQSDLNALWNQRRQSEPYAPLSSSDS
ncbi:hypothetical protein U14_02623 [Candidatus Moduliflexus flocculans]|uniref:DUF4231 domain-containing protein n=1 Tax=Candidatus Moduliflexus flocculans TaxID=1499966 RepID=A0A081BLW3_9BACT|nr:hypothetical protein U14_02623 [Candidatus Moduliflexus flocculans]